MDLMSIIIADVIAITVVVVAAVWVGLLTPPAAVRRAARPISQSLRHRRTATNAASVTRPLEQVAAHARRLHQRFHQAPVEGSSYAKLEAIRRAYDQVLAEGCDHLGIEHLLAVLPPGEELDVERSRVEARLEACGLVLSLTP